MNLTSPFCMVYQSKNKMRRVAHEKQVVGFEVSVVPAFVNEAKPLIRQGSEVKGD